MPKNNSRPTRKTTGSMIFCLTTLLATGDYETAFQVARKRWQTATEEKFFYQDNGYHKREGIEKDRHVHFYSPSTWLEKFWVAQRARTWRGEYPVQPGSELIKAAERLKAGKRPEAFSGKAGGGIRSKRKFWPPFLKNSGRQARRQSLTCYRSLIISPGQAFLSPTSCMIAPRTNHFVSWPNSRCSVIPIFHKNAFLTLKRAANEPFRQSLPCFQKIRHLMN